ncbi:hypothetical protein [Pseudoalteromonas sp. SR41-4]|uniref:hypothetical protein n=1 Tax=Pseudoalteromonas sp. SR41-4 TaxID=2760950 RepID=UPI001603CDD2|nr:hypothetical protein [Pseudoalteromonas sp. SR41-4]MBB1295453.1 hypothetical protein [Pseudoalteromonas sp. SR41-4]
MADEELIVMAYLLGFNGFKINTPYDSVTFEKNGQECILTKQQFIDIHLPKN